MAGERSTPLPQRKLGGELQRDARATFDGLQGTGIEHLLF
jgi:hypothetical protein